MNIVSARAGLFLLIRRAPAKAPLRAVAAAFFLLGVLGFFIPGGAAAQSEPRITGVSPEPVIGSLTQRWIEVRGEGFAEGFSVQLKTEVVEAHIDDRSRLDYISPERVRVAANFGTEAARWAVHVINPDGGRSNAHEFQVAAPAPQIELIRPREQVAGGGRFFLTVYDGTLTTHSVVRWNGKSLPTTALKYGDNPNALTYGLKARVPASAIAATGRNEVRVYTPPPGGGLSPPVTFLVKPRAFYRTTWFYLLLVAGLALFGTGLSWYRTRAEREKMLERQEKVLREKVEVRTRRLEREKEKTKAQARKLRALDEAKNRFFNNLSHEFRTPLTLIQGPIQDVLGSAGEVLSVKERRALERAGRSTHDLQRLVDQLLDLARLEAGRMALQPLRGDLAAFTREVVRSLMPLAERRGVALTHEAPPGRLMLDFDAGKLRAVLENLLANALKFTPPEGAVVVTVAPAEGQALIRVQDDGPGLPPEALEHVFDRFYQVDSSATRAHGGTGIGLSLARELVELHGGTIHAENEPDGGAAFVVRLPRAPSALPEEGGDGAGPPTPAEPPAAAEQSGDAEPAAATHSAPTNGASMSDEARIGEAPTVLVVEDNADVRAHVRAGLAPDYRVEEARDGAEALARVRAARPDLVLSDIMMPVMDGAALCRILKADDALSDLPVILLTARAGEAERVKGLHLGADDYVEKPFSMDELKARIENLIAGRHVLRERFGREVVMQPTGIRVTDEEEAFYERARAVVEAHVGDEQFTVGLFADEMEVTRSTLNRRLKAATGLTPARFVQHLRLERAAQILRQDPGRHVYAVASAVGYGSADHFAKLFHERFGVPPSAYPPGGEDGA